MNSKYTFDVTDTECHVHLAKTGEYLGTVTPVPGGRSIQKFARGVDWLPVHKALHAMGLITSMELTLKEMGY